MSTYYASWYAANRERVLARRKAAKSNKAITSEGKLCDCCRPAVKLDSTRRPVCARCLALESRANNEAMRDRS